LTQETIICKLHNSVRYLLTSLLLLRNSGWRATGATRVMPPGINITTSHSTVVMNIDKDKADTKVYTYDQYERPDDRFKSYYLEYFIKGHSQIFSFSKE
jgi:hypothetical protein